MQPVKFNRIALIIAIGFLSLCYSALAWADAVWVGSQNTNFFDPNNWNPKVNPATGTVGILTIGAGNPYNPTYNGEMAIRANGFNTTTLARLTLDGGELLPYGNNTINGEILNQHTALNLRGDVYLGNNGVGTVTVAGGSFSYKNTLYIGRGSSGNGALNVWGGNVWLTGRPTIGSNGGKGRISIKNDRFIYCPGDERTFFQSLVTNGTLTTDSGWTILITWDSAGNTTLITSTRIIGATEPAPSNGATDVPVTSLRWRPGTSASSSIVYLGTGQAAVAAATSSSPLCLGAVTTNSITIPYALQDNTTYYWRADTISSLGLRQGSIWQFTPSAIRAPRQMEQLGRGLIALYQGSGKVYVGWRLLGTDPQDIAFNLYRNGAKLNTTPVTTSTNWQDTVVNNAIANSYYVRPIINGVERAPSASYILPANPITGKYLNIPLNPVPNAIGAYFVYHAWAGDLDGDGEYDLVIARNSDSLATVRTLEAYRRDGTFLWRVSLGPNIQQTYVLVCDFDGNGRAEVVTKTAESTTFANGQMIGDTNSDGVTDYRRIGSQYEIWDGPEFLSILDGLTGVELDRTPFIPRGDISDWGDNYGHRANFVQECVAYLDGVHPSIVFNRGPGDYMKIWAWDFFNGKLQLRWTWFNHHHQGLPANQSYADFQQWRPVDLDGDGKDEISLGGSAIDDNGAPLYGTELAHGDRFQITDFDPGRPGLEVYAIQQNNPTLLGGAYYDAATGAMINRYYMDAYGDVGRGDSGDYDPRHKGIEFFSTMNGMYNCKGDLIYNEHPFPTLGIWWDADLRREFFVGVGSTGQSPAIEKWNYETLSSTRLWTLYNDGGSYNIISPYAGRPPFLGDIIGDWREEVVLERANHSELHIYSTTDLTTHRLYTLMHNPYYRVDVTHKGYTVTTYTDYYLGEDMSQPPRPNIQTIPPATGALRREWWTNITGSSISDLTGAASYPDKPTGTGLLTLLQTPSNWGDYYGARIRGYLHPPADGDYTFWIASDDSSILYISIDATPAHARSVAYVNGYTSPLQWTRYASQQSIPVTLSAGHKYYLEILHKEGTSADHLAVAWQGPGLTRQIIPGACLSPWLDTIPGDSNLDFALNTIDLTTLLGNWLQVDCAWPLALDSNGDCQINLDDFGHLSYNWLIGQ